MKICDGYSHGQVARELMCYNHKKKRQNKLPVRLPGRALNLSDTTNQEVHDASWFGAQGLNSGHQLVCQKVHHCGNAFSNTANFVSFNSREREIGEKSRGVIAVILLNLPD